MAAHPPNLQHRAPLTAMQRFIVAQCLAPAPGAWCYHTQYSYHLRFEALSLPLFFKAVKSVLERHPVLKTVLLPLADGAIGQAVNPQLTCVPAFADISALSLAAQDEWLRQYLLDDRRQRFNLLDQTVPLCRGALIKRGPDSLQLILVIHHAIWDGWSLAVLLKEIFAVYVRYQDNPTLTLPPAPYDYEDFIAAENAARPAPQSAAYWREHLRVHQDFRPSPRADSAPADDYHPEVRVLSDALSAALERRARDLRVTMKSLFIAAFIRMVQDETRHPSATIGVVSNGRGMALAHPLTTLGLLWNLAPLRVAAPDDDDAHVGAVHRALAESAPYSTYPLLDILNDAKTDTLFHAVFNYIDFGGANILPAGAGIEFLNSGGLDKFDFPLYLLVGRNPFNRRLSLVLNYDTRCYGADEARSKLDRLLERLERLSKADTSHG